MSSSFSQTQQTHTQFNKLKKHNWANFQFVRILHKRIVEKSRREDHSDSNPKSDKYVRTATPIRKYVT